MLSDSPPERDLQWTETGIIAANKFIQKLWGLVEIYNNYSGDESVVDNIAIIKLKKLINETTDNIEAFQFNKSVAKIYEYVNHLNNVIKNKNISKQDLLWSIKKLAIIIQPFIPHISEEIWFSINGDGLCINQKWPNEKIEDENSDINLAVQINGKTRAIIKIDNEKSEKEIVAIAKKNKIIEKYINDKKILKEIYVPGKILNFVI
tara:strand:- start:304 stop:921 length:618 start_codon:yes stop_codon:yes gene_type:complete